jgi:hypothetical protein
LEAITAQTSQALLAASSPEGGPPVRRSSGRHEPARSRRSSAAARDALCIAVILDHFVKQLKAAQSPFLDSFR